VNATQNEIVAALRGDYASGMNKLFRHFAEKVSFLAGTSWAFICALAALLSWGASGRLGRAARASRKALQLDSMSGFEAPFPMIRLTDHGKPHLWLFVINRIVTQG